MSNSSVSTPRQYHGELPGESLQLPGGALPDRAKTWVRLNVGGTMLETTRGTVDKLGSEFLALLLDKENFEDWPKDDIHRIDRDPEPLKVLLNYGRLGKIPSVPDDITEHYLYDEIKFYRMSAKVRGAVLDYFVEKRKGPSTVKVKRVSIVEMAMNTAHKHHNVYAVVQGASICCFTVVPGSGTCYRDVNPLFMYEKPSLKVPALFRVACVVCGRKVCLAEDELIGTEGWCHKCRRCLHCQNILCEDLITTTSSEDNNNFGVQRPGVVVSKTATVTFTNEILEPKRAPVAVMDDSAPANDATAAIGNLSPYLSGVFSEQNLQKMDTLALPKLPHAGQDRSPRNVPNGQLALNSSKKLVLNLTNDKSYDFTLSNTARRRKSEPKNILSTNLFSSLP